MKKNLNVQNIESQTFKFSEFPRRNLIFCTSVGRWILLLRASFESHWPTYDRSHFYICKVNRLFFWMVRFLGELFSLPENFENCWFLRAETEMENIPSPMSKIIYKILTLNLTRVYLTTLGFEGLSERGKTNVRKSIWDFFERKRIWSRFYSIF